MGIKVLWRLVQMLGDGSSLILCPINAFILTQDNIYNPVTNLDFGAERGFPASLVSTSVLSNADVSLSMYHSQFS